MPVEDERVDEDRLRALKAWRLQRAAGKPAYTVATDATLREILRRMPRTKAEVIEIRGVGRAFSEKHADSLLELLAGRDGAAGGDASDATRSGSTGPRSSLASVSSPT